ncbi:unnamed protein product [Darwinula stevensoni]|uniref:Reticulocalbin-3 n=1 Tax=Darwinula stevensoni TaxID=69355 RepID=A0A7R8X9W4_9CRUS|nr:unnamed protein product [Darwinula stevensoni]CAG0884797.1 unnamed protein product [Darwinula stevensoni]
MSIYCVAVFLCLLSSTWGFATHHEHRHSGQKERDSDGAYSPRDHLHYDEHGEHRADFDHEAILGSVKEAEAFHQLPLEEAKKRLRDLAEKMDKNHDGYVDKTEMKQWILRSFKLLSQEESEDRFLEMDIDRDGRVSWKEALADIQQDARGGEMPDDFDSDDEEWVREDRLIFEAADENRDGYLTRDEFLGFSHPEEVAKMESVLVRHSLDEKDSNADGKINFQEFVGPDARDQSQEWLITEKDRFDKDYDRNGDGFLDEKEIAGWLIPDNNEMADDEVVHLFSHADDDQDDLLSYDEILEHHDVFVGSEATDFGDHLTRLDKFSDEL